MIIETDRQEKKVIKYTRIIRCLYLIYAQIFLFCKKRMKKYYYKFWKEMNKVYDYEDVKKEKRKKLYKQQ